MQTTVESSGKRVATRKRVIADKKVNQDEDKNKRRKLTHEEIYDQSSEFRVALELQSVLEQYIRARKSCFEAFDLMIWEEQHEEVIDIILKLMHRLGYEPKEGEDEFDDPYRIITFVALKT